MALGCIVWHVHVMGSLLLMFVLGMSCGAVGTDHRVLDVCGG